MELSYSVSYSENILEVKVSGDYNLPSFKNFIENIYYEYTKIRCPYVLIDLLQMNKSIPNFDKFTIIEHLSKISEYDFKIAAINKPEASTNFSELVAANRGTNLKVFSNRKEAFDWLVKKEISLPTC